MVPPRSKWQLSVPRRKLPADRREMPMLLNLPSLPNATCAPLVAIAFLVSAGAAHAAEPIGPPDVFVRVATVRGDIELIRSALDRPVAGPLDVVAHGAAPREVYFQARTLFEKADRLCFAHTWRRARVPAAPGATPMPADVASLVDATARRLALVKQHLGITRSVQQRPRNPAHTPTDVFAAIQDANRQLNLLLDEAFTPNDVFAEVTRAMALASRLIAAFDGATRVSDGPALVAGKVPGDVFARLLQCYELIATVGRASGIDMLELDASSVDSGAVRPSDVFDIAALIVSELTHLHRLHPSVRAPIPRYAVANKVPSDVFVRASILEIQLTMLAKHVARQPRWLDRGDD